MVLALERTVSNITLTLDLPANADFQNTVFSAQTELFVRDGVIVHL